MKISVLVIAILFVWAAGAHAWVVSIEIEPWKPAVGEYITVTVKGFMPNSCWRVVDQHCFGAGGQEINIEVFTYDYSGRGVIDDCLMVLVPYEVTCTYRLPTPGPYTVTATEICDSLSPCTGGTITEVFDTRGPQR